MADKEIALENNWSVYIIHCSDNSLYTGITTDVERRFLQHKSKKGAKYFYAHEPKEIVLLESGHNRSSASQREYEIKQKSHREKWELIKKNTDAGNYAE